MMISIIIPTKDRPQQLTDCLRNISKNTYPHFEVLILDQSKKSTDIEGPLSQNQKIRHVHMPASGKSAAMNYGLDLAKGQIVAFTDDDCVVSKKWLSEISYIISKHRDIDGVFGKTLPYQPNKHPHEICPSTVIRNQQKTVSKPCLHSRYLGYGNNMAFRKEVFEKSGYFKEWLGPGSISLAAEDADLALQILIKKHKILYDPDMIVHHNKWLSLVESRNEDLSYICGEMACYGYYAFSGFSFAKSVVGGNFIDSYYDIRRIFGDVVKRRDMNFKGLGYSFKKILARTRGLYVAMFYYLRNLSFPTIVSGN
jgi:glycosyltransferase involved in cell wall biosynthesis